MVYSRRCIHDWQASHLARIENNPQAIASLTGQLPRTNPATARKAPVAFGDVLGAMQQLMQGEMPADAETAAQAARLLAAQVRMNTLSMAALDLPADSSTADNTAGMFALPPLPQGLLSLGQLTGSLTAPVAPTQPASADAKARFDTLQPHFIQAEKATGVPWQIQAAQWALETGWGASTPKDVSSGKESFNLFGIKGEGPAGSVVAMTAEFQGGRMVRQPAAFRAYNSYAEAVVDHAGLLTTAHYAPARAAGNDLRSWTVALQQLGYATDPHYGEKLWQIIQSNGWDKA